MVKTTGYTSPTFAVLMEFEELTNGLTYRHTYAHNRRLSTVIFGAPNNSGHLVQRHVYQGANRGQTLGLNTSWQGLGAVSTANTVTTNRSNGNVTANIIMLR